MSNSLAHENARHFRYQKIARPFRGSLKNATAMILSVEATPVSEEDFLTLLRAEYPRYYGGIEWVKFHQFQGGWRKHRDVYYRLAVINVIADPVLRETFYADREEIYRRTGWYPLIQGSRVRFFDTPYRDMERHAHRGFEMPPIGTLRRVEPVAASDTDGNSFLVVGDQGTLLLDCGMRDVGRPSPSAIFLSHFHRDHAGGVWPLLRQSDLPVVLSPVSLKYLCALRHIPEAERRALARCSVYPQEVRAAERTDGTAIEIFPVFHCPGAYGLRIEDRHGNALTYFGDLCLRNGFHNFTEEAYQIAARGGGARWALLDAALVGRHLHGDEGHVTLKSTISNLLKQEQRRNLIFICDRPETQLYSYIQSFIQTMPVRAIKYLISPELYHVVRTLWQPQIARDVESSDPVVRALLGNFMHNFAETQRLYPLAEQILRSIDLQFPCVIFADPTDLARMPSLRERAANGDIFLSGTLAVRDTVPVEVSDLGHPVIHRIASADWGFHSEEADLAAFIRRLTAEGVNVVLFHNFPHRIEHFIHAHHLDKARVQAMRDAPFELYHQAS